MVKPKKDKVLQGVGVCTAVCCVWGYCCMGTRGATVTWKICSRQEKAPGHIPAVRDEEEWRSVEAWRGTAGRRCSKMQLRSTQKLWVTQRRFTC